MLEPDSRLLVALLIVVSVASLVAAVRLRPLVVKIACSALAIMVAMIGGVATVNNYYGYYTTWGELWADFHTSGSGFGVVSAVGTPTQVTSGRLGWISLPGRLSGYNRLGLVYLPPQYSEAKYARVRFPVVELFHGTPGSPRVWITVLQVSRIMNTLVAEHKIGPMILVMPTISGPHRDPEECVNGPSLQDETYLTRDVRADVLAHYRASGDPYEWGAAGYSSGGYCAANLAMRHRDFFGAAAIIEGYYRATDGPAARMLGHSKSLQVANSPLYLAESAVPGSGPIPAFWVAAGTADKTDYRTANYFVAALARIEQVPLVKLKAADNPNAWSAALPSALTWMWQQLAPPDLRVLFPVRAYAGNPISTLPVRPAKPHAHRPAGGQLAITRASYRSLK